MQQGISEKIALVVSFLSAFVTGFVLAYIRSWRLALALSSILPCIAITGAVMNKAISKYMQYVPSLCPSDVFSHYHNRLSLRHVAQGGSLAEEVISTVRTAQAFGSQNTLSGLYSTHVDQSRKIELRSSIFHGCGLAVFFFVIYSSYALCQSLNAISISSMLISFHSAFSFGTTLINQGYGECNVMLAILLRP